MVEAGLNEAGERPGALARVSGRSSGNPTVSAITGTAPYSGAVFNNIVLQTDPVLIVHLLS